MSVTKKKLYVSHFFSLTFVVLVPANYGCPNVQIDRQSHSKIWAKTIKYHGHIKDKTTNEMRDTGNFRQNVLLT